MADVDATQSSDPTSSVGTLSEHAPLLPTTFNPAALGYKSTATIQTADVLSQEETGPVEAECYYEEDSNPQSAFAIISLLLIGVFASSADSTLVIATYATVSSEFGALGSAAWLTTSYTLAMCASQAIVGKLSDIYGRKAVLLVSYVGFATGNVLT
jgi:hypothetical protein